MQKEILEEKMQELQVRRPIKKTEDLTATQKQNLFFRVLALCQELEKTSAELSHQLVELSENINNKRKNLALARKDRRQTKELQRDELEVHPVVL